MPSAVIFDLFGTLIPNFSAAEYRQVTDAMAETVGAPPDDFAYLIGSGTWALRATGALPSVAAAVAHVCDLLGIVADESHIVAAARIRTELTRHALQPLPGVVETLIALRARAFPIGLISDCSAEVPLLWDDCALAPLIDAAIFSCAVGMKKPDPRIYAMACERLGVRPDDCLYVGDGSGRELSGAADAGMQPVLVRVAFAETTDTERPEIAGWQGIAIETVPDVLRLIEAGSRP